MKHPDVLAQLARAWSAPVQSALRGARYACVLTAIVTCALLGRQGTLEYRAAALGLLATALLLLVLHAWLERRAWRNAWATIRRVLVPADPELGARALRAASLVERAERDRSVGSPELAALHYERLLKRASLVAVQQQGRKQGWIWRFATLGLLGASALAVAPAPVRIVEGLNVLVARNGRAPLPMQWMNTLRITSQPPAYLHGPQRFVFLDDWIREPRGSVLTVRGIPRFEDRELVLTDGEHAVPFAQEGEGGVVARWTLERSSNLHVAARFGAVRVYEPEGVFVRAVPDAAPAVELETAPKALPLTDFERLELSYSASDDHGLRQVDLVLRSGQREERRVLSRFDGQSRATRGGTALNATDPFFRRAFLPIAVSVEARDDDTLSGVKWGRSQPITLLPPSPGELEAGRFARLRQVRDTLTDVVAEELERGSAPRANAAGPPARLRTLAADLRNALENESAASAPLVGALRAFLLGHARKLETLPAHGAARTAALKDALLELDSALRALATRDARSVSKRLGDVAEEIAEGAHQGFASEAQAQGLERMNAAAQILREGALKLQVLGVLGRDLGSVATGELGRIQRARDAANLSHAELAARHLAARLRRPNPSFTTTSRSSGKGESGSGLGPTEPGDGAGVGSRELERLLNELEQLTAEHGSELQRSERELSGQQPNSPHQNPQKLQEASEREQALARKAEDLAHRGASGEAALPDEMADTLEQAQRMMQQAAREMQKGQSGPAIEAARNAQRLLERAGMLENSRENSAEPTGQEDGQSDRFRTGAEVPRADQAHRAEEFRRRVLEGLGREKGVRLSPAVQRYAEGLLK